MSHLRLAALLSLILVTIAVLAIVYFGVAWVWAGVALVASFVPSLIRELIWPLIIEVMGGKAEKHTPDTISGLRTSLLNPANILISWRVRKHLNEQMEIIRKMPFVFEDIMGIEDLLENFIDISATSIDILAFKPKPTPPSSIKHFSDTLRENKKAVLLGDAGTGKTTFQRHTALTIIQNRPDVPYLESMERVVPFYIQLRLIDNSVPFPIRWHLLNKTTYGAGTGGRKRLLRLAKEGRLFLFLDGYDETPFSLTHRSENSKPGATTVERHQAGSDGKQPADNYEEVDVQEINYLRDELKLILSPNMARIQSQKDRPDADIEFYKHLQGCRVWLTCRKPYFRNQRPFTKYEVPTTGLAALEIFGVDSRKNLIQKVFDRYKLIQDNKDLFEAGLFFNMINRDVGELRSLSDNPLLLIIICRLYAYEVVRTRNPRVQIANTLDAIIEKYFELLLEGLDRGRNKGLGLTIAQEEWQREARGLYTSDKREFLKYFAARLYVENIGGFTKEFIYAKAIKYFNEVSSSEHKQEILEGLEHRPALTDFVGQIINSNIVVENAEEGPKKKLLFDFPHQRFRELLAAQYFDSYDNGYILQNLQRTALNELLYVYFRITSHKDAVVVGLLEHIAADPKQTETYFAIFSRCLQESPGYNPKEAFRTFISRCLELNLPFDIPKELRQGFEDGRYFAPDQEFKQRLAKNLSADEETVTNSAKLAGELLLIYGRDLLRYVLTNYFNCASRKHDADSFNFRAELLRHDDHRSPKDFFPNLFLQLVECSNVHNLKLCSNFIGEHAPETLKGLFASTVEKAVQQAAVCKDFENPPQIAILLSESNRDLLNSTLSDYLLNYIAADSFRPLQYWLVDLHKPTKNFTQDWADAMRRALDEGRLYSLWLAIELGMHYDDIGFQAQARRLLLPALKAGNSSLVQLAIINPRINKFLWQAAKEDEEVHEILALAEMHDTLAHMALGAIKVLPSTLRTCHIVTYQIIRELQRFTQEHGVTVIRKDWQKIYKMTHKVLLENSIRDQLSEVDDDAFVTKLIELSRFSYANYELVVKCMSELDVNAPREKTYLDRKASGTSPRRRLSTIRNTTLPA